MVSMNQLAQWSNVGIQENHNILTDLESVTIQGTTAAERLDSLLEQTPNPYCFKVGKNPVKISFTADTAELKTKLAAYFINLKSM